MLYVYESKNSELTMPLVAEKSCPQFGEIRIMNVRDAIHKDRTARRKNRFFIVGVQCAGSESGPGRQSAKAVADLQRNAGKIVIRKKTAVIRGNHQIPFILWDAAQVSGIWIDKALQHSANSRFAAPLFAANG